MCDPTNVDAIHTQPNRCCVAIEEYIVSYLAEYLFKERRLYHLMHGLFPPASGGSVQAEVLKVSES